MIHFRSADELSILNVLFFPPCYDLMQWFDVYFLALHKSNYMPALIFRPPKLN